MKVESVKVGYINKATYSFTVGPFKPYTGCKLGHPVPADLEQLSRGNILYIFFELLFKG